MGEIFQFEDIHHKAEELAQLALRGKAVSYEFRLELTAENAENKQITLLAANKEKLLADGIAKAASVFTR